MKRYNRLLKVFTVPFKMFFAALYPVAYAKKIGVTTLGDVTIYGSSYYMFSSEPYLVTLGDNVFISVGTEFVCHDGSTLPYRRKYPDLELAGEIIVGDNVFIGKGVTILPGVTIGSNCVIGACSVVTKDVPDNSVYVGIPARFVKTSEAFLQGAKERSLKIGHLTGKEKIAAYKSIFSKQ